MKTHLIPVQGLDALIAGQGAGVIQNGAAGAADTRRQVSTMRIYSPEKPDHLPLCTS